MTPPGADLPAVIILRLALALTQLCLPFLQQAPVPQQMSLLAQA
jgi:hypothetical protein